MSLEIPSWRITRSWCDVLTAIAGFVFVVSACGSEPPDNDPTGADNGGAGGQSDTVVAGAGGSGGMTTAPSDSCGNDVCEASESCGTCVRDCPCPCGDGVRQSLEQCD